MSISVNCESCSYAFRVRDELAGKRGKCPKCGSVLVVPAAPKPVTSSVKPPPPIIKPAPAQVAPLDDTPRIVISDSPTASSGDSAFPQINVSDAPGATAGHGAASIVTTASSQPALNASDDRASGYGQRRKQSPAVPAWAWLTGAAAVLVIGLGGIALAMGGGEEEGKKLTRVEQRDLEHSAKVNPAVFKKPRDIKPAPKALAADASREDIVEYVEYGVVKIEARDQYNNYSSLGSGVVIGDGLVATNYHVVREALSANALFNTGERFGVLGYVALRPESDLAIIKLNGMPENAKILKLAHRKPPRKASDVIAVGHPHGNEFEVTKGIVSSVKTTKEMEASSKEWLDFTLTDKVNNLWIAHDAKISPGNSGGPLLNSAGEVIGINTWVNTQVRLGYAVSAQHLHELRQNLFSQPAELKVYYKPMRDFGLAKIEEMLDPKVEPQEIRDLREELAKEEWNFEDEERYKKWFELAKKVTMARMLRDSQDNLDPDMKKKVPELNSEADATMAALSDKLWTKEDFEKLNQHAAQMTGRQFEGIACHGTFEEVWEKGEKEDKRRGLLFKLTGGDQRLLIPLDASEKSQLEKGDSCLIMGLLVSEIPIDGGGADGAQAMVILSDTFLKLSSEGKASEESKNADSDKKKDDDSKSDDDSDEDKDADKDSDDKDSDDKNNTDENDSDAADDAEEEADPETAQRDVNHQLEVALSGPNAPTHRATSRAASRAVSPSGALRIAV